MSHHGHGHGHHGHSGHSNFVSADFGEQVAAGGASRLEARSQEYWERWGKRNSWLSLWPLAFLIVCFIAVAAFPVLLDNYLTNQADANAGPSQVAAQTHPSVDSPANEVAAPISAEPPATVQTNVSGVDPLLVTEPTPDPNAAFDHTAGYDSRFGHPSQ